MDGASQRRSSPGIKQNNTPAKSRVFFCLIFGDVVITPNGFHVTNRQDSRFERAQRARSRSSPGIKQNKSRPTAGINFAAIVKPVVTVSCQGGVLRRKYRANRPSRPTVIRG